ncbi:hypothetical protein [Actinomadura madurae]|uniref:hypothetical protein n=1 Tax=Actinomadura madurae TaxID=1993 RepID=UPI0020D211C8|nr:hypothetical protein [Actinomadura madurae]MCQ0011595.1 hypothetical protein [Actinomadura madurae]
MIDVVLPCLNEAEALPWVLTRMPEGFRALVVDNASTDDSARVAAEHGARVVPAPPAASAPPATPGSWPPGPRSCASWTPTPRSTRPSCPG